MATCRLADHHGSTQLMPEFKYTKRCGHTHFSGRQCAERVAKWKEDRRCPLHTLDLCAECKVMLDAFTPKAGWKGV